MIVSIRIAELGPKAGLGILRRRLQPGELPGLRFAETVFTAPLGGGIMPGFDLGTVALVSVWENDEALDDFASHPLAERFAAGWQVRLQPLRLSGSWPEVQDLLPGQQPVDDEEPVAVLTWARVLPWRMPAFLRAATPAEEEVLTAPGLLASTGFGRLPRRVSTFSLWRTASAMRDYAYRENGSHRAAVAADKAHPFHASSAFIRFRPYRSGGSWAGRDPLASTQGDACTAAFSRSASS